MAYGVETHKGITTSGRDGLVNHTRTFRYNTEALSSRSGWALVGIGIDKYDPHPDFPTCLAVDASVNPIEGELGWFDASYTYSNKPFDQGNTVGAGSPGQNDPSTTPPAARTPVVKFTSNTRTIPFTLDYDPNGRKAVANSAGQPLEGIEVENSTCVISCSFNLTTVDVQTKQQTFLGKVNDDSFAILTGGAAYPAGTLKCNAWNGSYQYEADYGWYTACEVEIEYNWDGWHKDSLDCGFYEKNSDGSKSKIIDKRSGQPVDSPVKLDGAGLAIVPGETLSLPSSYTSPNSYYVIGNSTQDIAVYRRFFPYNDVNFDNIFA